MKITKKKVALGCAICGAQVLALNAAAESELDLAVGSEMVSVDYSVVDETRGSLWGAGITHNEDASATAVSATYNAVGSVSDTQELRSGLGLKAVVHDTFQTAGSLALGGTVRYEPMELAGFGVEGQLYYAPEILNTNDADQYYELLARVTYDVHPRARVFAGWLDKTISYEDTVVDEVELSNTFNVGFTIGF